MSRDQNSATRPSRSSRSVQYVVPVFGVGIGLAYLVAGIAGGRPGFGVFGLALMVGCVAAMAVLRRYSETVQGLMDRRGERINQIALQATAVAGFATILAALAGFVVSVAANPGVKPGTAAAASPQSRTLGPLALASPPIVQR